MKETKILSYGTNEEFSGNNEKVVNLYKDLLINNNMLNEDEDLILVSESQLRKYGGNLKEFAMPISLDCPPDVEHKAFFKEFFYPISQIEHFNEYIPPKKEVVIEEENFEPPVPDDAKTKEHEKEQEPIFSEDDISYKNVLIPQFAIMTDKGFKSYTDCIIENFDNNNKEYTIRTGSDEVLKIPKDTIDRLYKNDQEIKELQKEQEKKEDVAVATGVGIVFQDLEHGIEGTHLPNFSLIDPQRSDGILKTFSNYVVQTYNSENESYVISNGDTDLVLKKKELEEIVTSERLKNNEPSELKYEKLLQTQYEDFFKPRQNNAENFIHNFQVYCRKEANSPLDGVKIAKEIISKMDSKEQRKTKSLLNEMKDKNQTMSEALVDLYDDAVKVVPLNERYIEKNYPHKFIPRSFYDTISAKGEPVANFIDLKRTNKLDPSKNEDRNLRIGDTLKNVRIPVDKTFGKGKETVLFEELTVVSASKEKNSITLKNKDKSLIELPRDKFLEIHKEATIKEMKKEYKAETKLHKPKKDLSIEIE